ncbi:MAG TPA: TetR/AcrR family transcriptional regulator [Pseudonocardia sp.]|nr:TetR/AcrR family transcriptional regulator [Pseudonocardia sp.]
MSTPPSRRDEILAAGLASFLEHGVAGASIEDVRARSGASVGSIYHHFGGKRALAGAVYTAALASYQERFLDTLARCRDDAGAGVREVVLTHLRWCLDERPDYARFLLFHADTARAAAGDELIALNREFFDAALAWLRPHTRAGHLRELDVDLLYALWLGPAQEYCRLVLSSRVGTGSVSARAELADGAWRTLRG